MIEAIELTSTRRPRGVYGGPVQNVSFDVYPGQVTALLGAPGAGKSTVLRLMVELEPGGGRTLFGGLPFRALRPAVREVGLALNPDAVHPGRTVQAHLQLYAAGGGVPKGRVAEVLEVAGLSTQATVRCGRLDAGQRQRLAIAAALIGDPAALILDEPHALDTQGMSWFHALIRAYAAQGRTVLVAATDPDALSGTADHVVVLRRDEHDGISRVIASRSAAEVFDERRATVVQVRSPQAARLAAALETEGAQLAPAGPGALQVRGLDRARIGEVAHVAGICLHELSEIGHDDDVFGLRPVPRQKDLLPGLNRVDSAWRSGVRVVAEPEVEVEPEAELGEGDREEAQEGEKARLSQDVDTAAGLSAGTVVASRAADGDAASAADQKPKVAGTWRSQGEGGGAGWSAARVSRSNVVARPAEADKPAGESASVADGQGTRQEATQVLDPVVADAEAPRGASAAPQSQQVTRVQDLALAEDSHAASGTAELRQPTQVQSSAPVSTTGAAELRQAMRAQGSTPVSASGTAEMRQPTRLQTSAPVTGDAPHAASAAPEPRLTTRVLSQGVAPTAQASHHRGGSLGFRWGRRAGASQNIAPQPDPAPATPASSSPPPPSQPAVPFTVAPVAEAAGVGGDGMTPWRAVAARATQQGSQVSVAEAAPAEQDASA